MLSLNALIAVQQGLGEGSPFPSSKSGKSVGRKSASGSSALDDSLGHEASTEKIDPLEVGDTVLLFCCHTLSDMYQGALAHAGDVDDIAKTLHPQSVRMTNTL